jgi:glycosyltransferase involved in cell wall biosynthesis
LDGNSTDKTREIANSFGIRIVPQFESQEKNIKINDFTAMREKALSLCKYDWVLNIDSDEWLSPGLVSEIAEFIKKDEPKKAGFAQEIIVLDNGEGRKIEQAFSYPQYTKVRIFNKKSGIHFKKGKMVHERLFLPADVTRHYFTSPAYFSWPTYQEFFRKMKYYLALEIGQQKKVNFSPMTALKFALMDTAQGIYIFLKELRIQIIYGPKKTIPFKFIWPFVYYHFMLAWNFLKKNVFQHWI